MRHWMVGCAVVLAGVVLAGSLFVMSTAVAGETEIAATDSDNGVVAYYFHGNKRCSTCRKLEAYSEEAIVGGFSPELEAGELEWRVVNVDEKANAHFTTDFDLVTKSVVLAEYRNGKVVRFRNLKLVWQLVGDEDGFVRYVRDETRDFLAEG